MTDDGHAGLLRHLEAAADRARLHFVAYFGMRHLDRVRTLYGIPKRKAPHTGEVVCGAEEANTGEELFAVLCEAYLVGITSKP